MFSKQQRQEIINSYLNETSRNYYVANEFVEWISDKPDHKAYTWIFDSTDKEAAFKYRVGRARQFAQGLRISVQFEQVDKKVSGIVVRDFPSMVSPISNRSDGGGYVSFDPNSPEMRKDLIDQGVLALSSWIERYSDVYELEGYNIAPIRRLQMQVSNSKNKAA